MKSVNICIFLVVLLSSCGQTASSHKQQGSKKPTNKDAPTVYQRMTGEICDCISGSMRNYKPSTTSDSCSKVVVDKYTDRLKTLGYDPATQTGQNKLMNEIRFTQCPDLYTLMQKEWEDEDAGKLLFKGRLVSQTKIPSGLYEVIMKNSTTSETKIFFAKTPLDDTHIKKYEPGYELTVEYEIIRNTKAKKDEFFLKEGGKVMSVGAVKVENLQ